MTIHLSCLHWIWTITWEAGRDFTQEFFVNNGGEEFFSAVFFYKMGILGNR